MFKCVCAWFSKGLCQLICGMMIMNLEFFFLVITSQALNLSVFSAKKKYVLFLIKHQSLAQSSLEIMVFGYFREKIWTPIYLNLSIALWIFGFASLNISSALSYSPPSQCWVSSSFSKTNMISSFLRKLNINRCWFSVFLDQLVCHAIYIFFIYKNPFLLPIGGKGGFFFSLFKILSLKLLIWWPVGGSLGGDGYRMKGINHQILLDSIFFYNFSV